MQGDLKKSLKMNSYLSLPDWVRWVAHAETQLHFYDEAIQLLIVEYPTFPIGMQSLSTGLQLSRNVAALSSAFLHVTPR